MKKSLMRHLFTYGPVPVGEAERVPLKETEVGLVPEHWKVQVLENVASFVRDSLNPSNYPDEVFDYYSIPAYQETGSPILEVGKRIRSQKLVVEANDVLFGKLNPRIPKVLLVTASRRRKITSTEFIPLRASSRTVVPEYLYYLCWSNYVMRKAQELVSGSTPSRQRVDVRAFLSLPVPLPPLSEQREIVRILQSADKKLQAEEARKQALEELFKTLLHNLMTGKIRAKDVVLPNVGEGKGDVTN
jgi:type I restriction enzyme S subunit